MLEIYFFTCFMHRRTHGLQTYGRRPWLIVLVNLDYSFNVHAWLPLRVSILCRTLMLLPIAGTKVADWLLHVRGFIQYAN